MSNHKPRIIPPHALVEITCVVLQNRYLLRPSDEVNDLVLGVIGEAQRKYEMRICSVNVASNHLHMLIVPRDSGHMASFMDFVNGNIAKEIGKLHDWPGKFWKDRYHHIVVSDEEVAQVSRLEYHLGHGVKEALVDRVDQWPGVHCAEALLTGNPLVGHWCERRKLHAARQLRGESDATLEDYTREVQVVFEPLPCWKDRLTEEEVRKAVNDRHENRETRSSQAKGRKHAFHGSAEDFGHGPTPSAQLRQEKTQTHGSRHQPRIAPPVSGMVSGSSTGLPLSGGAIGRRIPRGCLSRRMLSARIAICSLRRWRGTRSADLRPSC